MGIQSPIRQALDDLGPIQEEGDWWWREKWRRSSHGCCGSKRHWDFGHKLPLRIKSHTAIIQCDPYQNTWDSSTKRHAISLKHRLTKQLLLLDPTKPDSNRQTINRSAISAICWHCVNANNKFSYRETGPLAIKLWRPNGSSNQPKKADKLGSEIFTSWSHRLGHSRHEHQDFQHSGFG